MDSKAKRRAALLADAKEYAAAAKFYAITGTIYLALAVFFYKIYIPCGRIWDQEILVESIRQGGPLVQGTHAREAVILTVLCGVPGIGSLFWAAISWGRMQATLREI